MDESAREALDVENAAQDESLEERENEHAISLILFTVISLAAIVYLAIGSIEARIWRFGNLNFEDRSIRHVWAYFGDRLPDMPGQGIISALYWLGLAVMVLGTIAGLWLFLVSPDDEPDGRIASRESTQNAPQPAPHDATA